MNRVVNVYYAVTYRCPYSCPFCFNSEKEEPFDLDAFSLFLDEFLEFKAKADGPASLTLTGGEPLICRNLGQIVARLAATDLETYIVTAGAAVSGATVDALVDAGIRFTLSLDCCIEDVQDKVRGRRSFANVMRVLRHLQARNVHPKIVAILNSINQPHLEPTVAFVRGLGISRVVLVCISLEERSPHAYLKYELPASRLGAIRERFPEMDIAYYATCPPSLNVSPAGNYFIQLGREYRRVIGSVGESRLEDVVDAYSRDAVIGRYANVFEQARTY